MRTTVPATLPIFNDHDMDRLVLREVAD
jgi:hypothetical protein